uniref:F-box domain-containing protein n=1 Tax=Strigamia maritima TaxID=126957 RepID=T1JA99_STRMM
MGGGESVMADTSGTNSYSRQDSIEPIVGLNGLTLGDHQLSPEIICTVLSYVPVDNLILNCRLVCKNWKYLIDDQTIWRLKCDQNKIALPRSLLVHGTPLHFYRTMCIKNPYGRNFIKNPCGEEGMRYWHYRNGGNGWVIEKPPVGADDFNQVEELCVAGIQSCFASSYQSCTKYQTIDLISEGCHDFVLDQVQPEIKIEDWHAGRFDCACRYVLLVQLLDGMGNELQQFTTGDIDEPQWTGRKWSKVKHTFSDYGAGLRYIKFFQRGHDLQFWNGNYGSKMTASSICITLKN